MECTYSDTSRHVHMYISCTQNSMWSVCHVAQVCNAGVLVLATIFGGLFAIDVASLYGWSEYKARQQVLDSEIGTCSLHTHCHVRSRGWRVWASYRVGGRDKWYCDWFGTGSSSEVMGQCAIVMAVSWWLPHLLAGLNHCYRAGQALATGPAQLVRVLSYKL